MCGFWLKPIQFGNRNLSAMLSTASVLTDLANYLQQHPVRYRPQELPRSLTVRYVVSLLLFLLHDQDGSSGASIRQSVIMFLTVEYRSKQRVPFEILPLVINRTLNASVMKAQVLNVLEHRRVEISTSSSSLAIVQVCEQTCYRQRRCRQVLWICS